MCKIDSWWEPAIKHRNLGLMLWDDLEGWMGVDGREALDRGDMHILIADSRGCIAEPNTTL